MNQPYKAIIKRIVISDGKETVKGENWSIDFALTYLKGLKKLEKKSAKKVEPVSK